MNIQRKKGLLEACVLAALLSGPSYGYKIIQEIADVIPISESTLYPILRRLESMECLLSFAQQHSGRNRKYYQITPGGEKLIEEFLDEWDQIAVIYDFVSQKHNKDAQEWPEENSYQDFLTL